MRAPLQLTGSIRTKSRLIQGAHLFVLVALGGLFYQEAQLLLKASPAVTSTDPGAQAIQAHFNEISSGITAYLQNHDTASLERIKAEGKEATRLVQELKVQLDENGKSEAGTRMEDDHQNIRQAVVGLLAADHEAFRIRQAQAESNTALSSLLDQMQSTIRSTQLNASARRRAVRAAQAEVASHPNNASRFNRAMNAYEDLSGTHRAERWADEARTDFRESLSLSAELAQADEKKQTALDRFEEKKKVLNKSLHDAFTRTSPKGRSGWMYVVLNSVLIALGIVLVLRTSRHSEHALTRPLQDILKCVEAAASGDTSRVPEHWSTDEVGQLSQATARLISVLARSENLIYHLAALVESSGDAIISQTLDGKILSWNKGAQRIYGYSAEEVKGQSISILSPADGGAEMMQHLQRIRGGERLPSFETLHQARNGRHVSVLVRVAAIHDSTRQIIGASFIAQDLSGANLLRSKNTEKNKAA